MKFLVTLCLMACLATVAWTSSATWGRRMPKDFLLHREEVVRRPIKNNFQSYTVVFPKPGQYNRRNITYMTVMDNFRNSSGANPRLWSGGPGYPYTQIQLQSTYSSGVNSTVIIWGR